MLRIDDTIFSFNILEKKFRCNLPACLGNCCRYGDSGAPLSVAETLILDEIWDEVKSYLRPEGVAVIEANGRSVSDFENERVTPLIGNEECAYTILKDNILMCGIELAWTDGKISFKKPLSCHLFPVRIKYYSDFRAVNYEKRFKEQILSNPNAIKKLSQISKESRNKNIYLVCYEGPTKACHRRILLRICEEQFHVKVKIEGIEP